MFENFKVSNSVIIEPIHLTENIYIYLETTVQDKFIGTCSEKHGYVIEVKNVTTTSNKITASDSLLVFDVQFEVTSLFPRVGNRYTTVSFINAFDFKDCKGALFNLYETENKNSIQIFITNTIKNKDELTFVGCDCVLDCKQKNSCQKIDVIVDFAVYKNGFFRITGKHIH